MTAHRLDVFYDHSVIQKGHISKGFINYTNIHSERPAGISILKKHKACCGYWLIIDLDTTKCTQVTGHELQINRQIAVLVRSKKHRGWTITPLWSHGSIIPKLTLVQPRVDSRKPSLNSQGHLAVSKKGEKHSIGGGREKERDIL